MTTFLTVAGWSAFGLVVLIGTGLNLLGLFGNWIILVAIGAAWMLTGFQHFGWPALLIMVGLATLGEVLEAVLASAGAAKFGGGKGAAAAALVGCIAGAVVGTPLAPILGTLLGACLGAFVAAALYEYIQMEKDVRQAVWTGVGAALGKLAGFFAKTFLGFAILFVAWFTY